MVQNNEKSEVEEDQEFAELVRRISQGETTGEEYAHVSSLLKAPSPTGDND